jgi:hypothetical protein
VCVDRGRERVGILVTPPDARRLSLVATALDGPAGVVELEGTFATVDWTPCRGAAAPGVEVVLCESGGDTGAVAAAGGLLDLTVRAGGSEQTARISLSTLPGGHGVDVYRLPVPGGGTVEITARWDEGPVGAGPEWLFAAGP